MRYLVSEINNNLLTLEPPALCGETPMCPGLPFVSSEQSLRIIWDAVSQAWSLKNVCWIKSNAQLLGCTCFFSVNNKIGPFIVYSTYVSYFSKYQWHMWDFFFVLMIIFPLDFVYYHIYHLIRYIYGFSKIHLICLLWEKKFKDVYSFQ